MSKTPQNTPEGSYLFSVDILVRASSNGAALEQLLHGLNIAEYADYKVQTGVTLGSVIDQELDAAPDKHYMMTEALDERIRHYIKSSRLIRIQVNKGKGVKLSMPCRVVNFDPDNELLTLYHVDEKRVYSISLNEIEDFLD